ncbi:MAG: glycosyltransferase [Ktedonobacterales bacterium]
MSHTSQSTTFSMISAVYTLGLRQRGHDVLFAVEDSFRPPLEGAGFPVARLPGDAYAMLAPYARQMYGGMTPFAAISTILHHYILPTLRPKVDALRSICANADLLILSPTHFAGVIAAELSDIPYVTIALTPTFRSRGIIPQPQPFDLPAPIQRLANRAAWTLGNATLRRLVDRPVNAVRAAYGLPSRRDLISTGNLSRTLSAIAVSPAFLTPPPDWPSYLRMTGFLFWDGAEGWSEPPALTDFFDGAKPVVAVSSGSMGPAVAATFAHFFATSIAAIHRAGARALVIGVAPGILPDPLPPDVLALDYAPFSLVYPHCAALIHHGGIGTTAQALRAGVPALVVPWGADQFFIGGQVARIGAGRWMYRQLFTPASGARALTSLLHDKRYHERARTIAEHIAREDGDAVLCNAIAEVLGHG